MKILAPVFSILVVMSLLCSLSIFLAGVFIFLIIQIFLELTAQGETLAAYLGVIAGALIFVVMSFAILHRWFFNIISKKSEENKANAMHPAITVSKFATSFILYKILNSLLYRNKKS